ncbi:hypothetical protein QVD17_28931 [Tagetes erecta]|uniref:Uncharacterized protein n=1 Tax=Tagetes erecta TaxID=13708 RepID=A0AAD8KE55_TARER|nr:hypothetical protein QVD17_28931 [Tagetes erecta]
MSPPLTEKESNELMDISRYTNKSNMVSIGTRGGDEGPSGAIVAGTSGGFEGDGDEVRDNEFMMDFDFAIVSSVETEVVDNANTEEVRSGDTEKVNSGATEVLGDGEPEGDNSIFGNDDKS